MDAMPYIAMPHIAIGLHAFAWIIGGAVLGRNCSGACEHEGLAGEG